ncbi:MAG: Arm DNA-binding domain-containing protein, partial [Alphaproteobacteria bacterium]|nr:Arm DNA-binding domain-containing protein [Alphaproteobacteria bacterium]
MQASNENSRRAVSPNRRKLTPLFVEKVEPSHRRLRIWDTEVRGLVLQVEPSGAKSWYVYYRRNGRPRWHRLGSFGGFGLSDAREAVRHINARLTLDPTYDPQAEKAANRTQGTVDDLFGRYAAEHLDGLKSGNQGEYLLRRFVLPKMGKLRAADVQRSDILSLLNGVPSSSTRGQVHANVGAMFNYAIRNDFLAVSVNPAADIQQRKQKARERVLSDREVELFWRWLEEVDPT